MGIVFFIGVPTFACDIPQVHGLIFPYCILAVIDPMGLHSLGVRSNTFVIQVVIHVVLVFFGRIICNTLVIHVVIHLLVLQKLESAIQDLERVGKME